MDGRACSSGSPSPTAGRSPTAGPSPGGGPSPSHGGGYSTFSGREELPDLTEHLKANGIYEDRVAPCSTCWGICIAFWIGEELSANLDGDPLPPSLTITIDLNSKYSIFLAAAQDVFV